MYMLVYLLLQKSFCSYRHYEKNLWLKYFVCSVCLQCHPGHLAPYHSFLNELGGSPGRERTATAAEKHHLAIGAR